MKFMGRAAALKDLPIDDVVSLDPREHEPAISFSLVGQTVQPRVFEQPRFVLLERVCDDRRAIAC